MQKKNLFLKLIEGKGQWQRWAWIIERKFDEWNLRIKGKGKTEHSERRGIEWLLREASKEEDEFDDE